jgi:ABC-type dipeptide/oligopeptide/nickel transport system permease component
MIRIIGLVFVLFMVSVVTFLLMHAIPGGPFDAGAGARGLPLSAEVRALLLRRYGLDKPIWVQYVLYMWRALHLDFGYSFSAPSETVAELIARTWPVSIHLGVMTMGVALFLGLPLGILSAMYRNTWFDYVASLTAIGGYTIPNFVIATSLILVFSIALKWMPTGGWDNPKQWIMPVMAYCLAPMATMARYTRASVIEALNSEYVVTARAKGLSKPRVVVVHVMKNALIPILTIAGPMIADLTTGSLFIETIFRVPGLGRYFTTSIFARDYPVIMATTLLWASLIGFVYLFTDILYAWADPRIRLGAK